MKAVFDERSINWTDNADYNIMYLHAKQKIRIPNQVI